MGMFSAAKDRAPNATLSFIFSKIRAKKNKVGSYLDSLERVKRERLIMLSVGLARNQRQVGRKRSVEIQRKNFTADI